MPAMPSARPLETLILTVREERVILNADLAAIYGVPTKALNQAIKRNADRFPADFVFQLSPSGLKSLRSQFVTPKRGGRRTAPYAFTEHGALMAANVLSSPQAVKMSVSVVRAFIKQRHLILSQAEILQRLAQIDKKLLQHDGVLRVIWQELQPLLTPPPAPPKREIGFHIQESPPRYRARPRRRKPPLLSP